jgi:hypothetical protein
MFLNWNREPATVSEAVAVCETVFGELHFIEPDTRIAGLNLGDDRSGEQKVRRLADGP